MRLSEAVGRTEAFDPNPKRMRLSEALSEDRDIFGQAEFRAWEVIAETNPQIQKWWSQLPESSTMDIVDFMKTSKDYNYKLAIEKGLFPTYQPEHKQLRWSDIGKEKPIPELRALTPEKIAASHRATPEEERALQRARDIKLIKEFPTDYYSGVPSWMDAFAQGILPIRPVELRRPGVEEAHPFAFFGGKLIGLAAMSGLTAPIAPAVTKKLVDFAPISPTLFRMIPHSLQRACLWGGKEFIDQSLRVLGGEELEVRERTGKGLSSAGFGFLTGALTAIPQTIPRIILSGIGRSAWISGETLIKKHKIEKDDLLNITLNGAIGSALEAINARAVSRAYKQMEIDNFLKNKTIVKIMATTGKTRAEAEESLGLIEAVRRGFNKPAQIEVLSKMPDNFTQMSKAQQAQWAKKVADEITKGTPVDKALEIAGTYLKQIIPPIGKPEVKPVAKPEVTIPSELQPLAVEARKYKTAEEFAVAQNKWDFEVPEGGSSKNPATKKAQPRQNQVKLQNASQRNKRLK